MSRLSDLMNDFAAKWGPKIEPGRATFLGEMAAMVSSIRDLDRWRIEERIEELRREALGDQKPAGVGEFEAMLREIAKERIHGDAEEGPVCSLCGGLVKPNSQVCHDPSCLTLRARKLLKDLGEPA